MKVKTRHFIWGKYKILLGVVYRASKRLARYLSNHDIFMSSLIEGLRLGKEMSVSDNVVDRNDIKEYKKNGTFCHPEYRDFSWMYIQCFPG